MGNLKVILSEMIEENKDQIMIVIRDDAGKVIESSEKIDFKQMCRYPAEEYYKYKSKIWSLNEMVANYHEKKVTVQIYINITKDIEEKRNLKKDKETNLITGENLEGVLNKLAKPLKTTSKGVTLILFSYDEELIGNCSNEVFLNLMKDIGSSINSNISKDDYGFRLDKNSFAVVFDNLNCLDVSIEKAEKIQIMIENKVYRCEDDIKLSPTVYFGIASLGTTRIPNDDVMTLLNLASCNLESQKKARKEVMKFINSDEEALTDEFPKMVIC